MECGMSLIHVANGYREQLHCHNNSLSDVSFEERKHTEGKEDWKRGWENEKKAKEGNNVSSFI